MQKLLLATAIAVSTSFTSFAALAADNSTGGAFAHIGWGQARYHNDFSQLDRRKTANYELLGGYRWGLGHSFALGVEGGFTHLGSIHRVERTRLGSAKYDLHAKAWLAGANAKWNMTKDFSLVGRAGVALVDARFDGRSLGNENFKARSEGSTSTAYFGLGVDYALTRHLDLTLQATRYGTRSVATANYANRWDIVTYNAGAEYRF